VPELDCKSCGGCAGGQITNECLERITRIDYLWNYPQIAFYDKDQATIFVNLNLVGKLWKASRILGIGPDQLVLKIIMHESHRQYASNLDGTIGAQQHHFLVDKLDKQWEMNHARR
jgi:hypothetical protein